LERQNRRSDNNTTDAMTTQPQKGSRVSAKEYFWPSVSRNHGFKEARARLLCGFSGILGTVSGFHNIHLLSSDPQFSKLFAVITAVFVLGYIWSLLSGIAPTT
jgi:hypothetical protein